MTQWPLGTSLLIAVPTRLDGGAGTAEEKADVTLWRLPPPVRESANSTYFRVISDDATVALGLM